MREIRSQERSRAKESERAVKEYYEELLKEKEGVIEKNKEYIMELEAYLETILVEHSKCKNDLERWKSEN